MAASVSKSLSPTVFSENTCRYFTWLRHILKIYHLQCSLIYETKFLKPLTPLCCFHEGILFHNQIWSFIFKARPACFMSSCTRTIWQPYMFYSTILGTCKSRISVQKTDKIGYLTWQVYKKLLPWSDAFAYWTAETLYLQHATNICL